MDPHLQRLVALTPPPAEPEVSDIDWDVFQDRLSMRLPTDYKQLVEAYGLGAFGHFLWVNVPMCGNKNLDLAACNSESLDALRYCQGYGEHVPYRIEAGREELFSWGGTDNGDTCYWVMAGDDPDSWTVTVNETRSDLWYPFDGGLAEFIFAALNQDIENDHPLGADRLAFIRAADVRYEPTE